MSKSTINEIDIVKEPPVKKARTAINVEGTTIFCGKFSKELKW